MRHKERSLCNFLTTSFLVVFFIQKGGRMTDQIKCVITYVRVSTKEQMQGYSIEAQSEELNNYIDYHYKDVSVERYSDQGKTATNINRRGLKRVLSRVESGEIDILIVKNLDRLVRNMENAIYIMKLLQLKKTRILTPYIEYDLSTVRGRKRFKEDAIEAEGESEKTSERVIASQLHMLNQGKYPWGGKVPYGYDKDVNCILSINETEAEIIKRLFFEYAYNNRTELEVQKIARNNYGISLSKSNIRSFLVKDLYWGYIENDGIKYNVVKPILTADDKEQLEKIAMKNKFSKHDYKFRNIVWINGLPCKHQTKYKNGKEYKYYYIRNYPYVEEREISKYIMSNKLQIGEAHVINLEDKAVQLIRGLIYGDIDKHDFERKLAEYQKSYKRKEQMLNRIDITISETGNVDFECS